MIRARALSAVTVLSLAGLLAACGDEPSAVVEAKRTDVPKAVASTAPGQAPAVETEHATPVKDRVAVIGLLNKRNNVSQDLQLKSGESRRVGNVIVKLASCERTAPWERPAETGAFVQVFVEERAKTSDPLTWRKVFSGWLFKNSPSLNVVEHPVYDVWVKDCAMKFPGEEDAPAPAASASSAAKPSGSASGGANSGTGPAAKPSAAPAAPATSASPD
jgi:hypothetical protein